MSRPFLTTATVVLVLALVLGSAAFSLVETERKVMAAAEAEGRALLDVVSTGVEKSLKASRAVEQILSERLLQIGRELDPVLASAPGREEEALRRLTARHRIKGALLLDAGFRVTARANPAGAVRIPTSSPVSSSRLEPMVASDLVRRVRAAGLGERDHVIVFGENPFGTRIEFLVGLVLPETGGFLLLRHDAEELRNFRRQAGVESLLADAAESDAVAWLALVGADGTVLATSEPGQVGHPFPTSAGEGWGDDRVLDVTVRVDWEGFPEAFLRVGLRAEPVAEVLSRSRRNVFLFTGIALLFGITGGIALAISIRARRRRDLLHDREIREREKSAALGRLAAGVAHEVRGPLNAIGMAAQRLEREAAAEEPDFDRLREIVPSVRREVARVNRTVEEFLDLGRDRPLMRQPVSIGALVQSVIETEATKARLEPPDDDVTFAADEEELRKALANLVRNARAAAGENGPVVVAWRRDGHSLVLQVRDGGPGVPLAERDRIFEHFVTGRPGGTGLGLAIVRSVVARHGGRIEVDDASEGGARFTMRLPNE